MTIEKLKDKLHDKIEIHVCEVEENTLIAQGMLKALGMMDEVLEKAEQEPTEKSNLEKICEELAAENDDLRDQLAMRDRFKHDTVPVKLRINKVSKHISNIDLDEQESEVTTTSTDEPMVIQYPKTDEPMVMQYPQVDGITPTVVKAEQEPTIEAYKQVCKERDIAIEQLHELGYELGQKIEPCEDVVSRQAVLKIIDGWYEQNRDTENIEDLIVLITYMDSVRPQEQTGHWILDETDNSITCDKCGCLIWANDISHGEAYYCPNCGAKMRREKENG